ncbi:Rhodopsin domain-containing protein [Madurella fahalii]|uniref:Rhodopsin domain-containing protein n=1 Tax=Madurella fahalii TaxID=1157608 RepID=A0ABQ0FZV0_9PEZI
MTSSTGRSEPENLGLKVNIVCLWWDDHILIVSWVLFLASICASSAVIPLGFGKHIFDISPTNLVAIGLISNVTSTFSMLAAVLSKTSFAVTLLRITEGYTKMCVWIIIVVMNIAMGLSALLTWVKCNPVCKTWDLSTPGTCWDADVMMVFFIFSAGISGGMDAALALLPWKILWSLRIRTQEKLGVAIAMRIGILHSANGMQAAATAVVKCTKLPSLSGDDLTYVASDVAIWSVAEIAPTILAACIPILRVLLHYVRSAAKQCTVTHEPKVGSHIKGTRAATMIVTGSRNQLKLHYDRKDEDTGSDRSILGRSIGVTNQIVQTSECILESDNQGRRKNNYESDSMNGYEMANRRKAI